MNHRNYRNRTIVHCAAAQHNYLFLQALQAIGQEVACGIPWDEPGGDDNRTPWQKQFIDEKPANPNSFRTATILSTMIGAEMPDR